MVPFKPYFVGDETPPYRRATSIQKCVRAGGKHNDLDDVGRTNRHFTFFEMLGNFSFGDYFKREAIEWAWELYTDVLGLDPERLWVTVHTTDDEAEPIWRDGVGLPASGSSGWVTTTSGAWPTPARAAPAPRSSGTAGPSSGRPPVRRSNEDRYVEIWNLVFMQFDAKPDGELVPLPAPSVDTGAGLERNLAVLQDAASIWDIDVFRPLIAAAEKVTGVEYGTFPGSARDVSLRILAEHGRTMTFLVADGVVPSNEERGYVLRRIIRRAVRHAFLLGAEQMVTPALVDATVDVMGGAYPEIVRQHELVRGVVQPGGGALPADAGARARPARRRARPTATSPATTRSSCTTRSASRSTSRARSRRSAGARSTSTASAPSCRSSARAPRRRTRPRAARARARRSSSTASWPTSSGPPTSPGARSTRPSATKVRALVGGRERLAQADAGTAVSVVLDRTPFYAESGGQVGDTGVIETSTGARVRVDDTQYGLPGLVLHRGGWSRRAPIAEGDEAVARIDGPRRDAIRRNHTATHVLHWALREVLGPHVKQAGSLVAPDRLRFDFSHHEAVTPRTARPHRGARERRDHRRRAGAPLRDHQGARGVARRDRVLRRQVRRPRTRARGRRALDRALRRDARARARLHRADQDRERGVDRRQPAPHRGGHRRGRARPHPRRRGRSCATSPTRCSVAPASSPIGSSGCSSR